MDDRVTGGGPAQQGLKFGPAAADYEHGRPDWPATAVERAAAALGLGQAAAVLEIGAGTGKLTRLLAMRFARVIAVEPLAPMRALLAANLPGVEVHEGTAERLPLPDGEVDAVFVADAFHWFDGRTALTEAARVLASGDRTGEGAPARGIALLWNLPAGPSHPPLPEPARRLLREAIARGGEPGGARLARGEWRAAFAGSSFAEPRHDQVIHETTRDRDEVVAGVMSISSVAGLPEEERDGLRARLRELIPAGRYRQPMRTDIYWAPLAACSWCDRCGEALARGGHAACAAARALEPPRFCSRCRRRMRVQVLPEGWIATCVEHGEVRSR